jgi:Flp pilus assembly protein TadD
MANVAQALQDAWKVHQQGEYARAESVYRGVLAAQPDNATAWCYLGIALHDQRRYDEAVAAYRRALELQPQFPVALSNLGNTLSRLGRLDEAAASCRAALQLKPDYVTAYNNLGAVLSKQGKLQEASEAMEAAIRQNPNYAAAHNNLGALLVKQGRLEEAEQQIEKSLQLCPEHGPSHNNLGALLAQQGKLTEAQERLEQAVQHNPQFESARTNLANTQLRQGDFEAARAALDATLEVNPAYAEARKAQALIWLLMGDFHRGWPAYEWRWRCEESGPPAYPKPLWDGSPLAGRTLLLHGEQGLGDTMHFVRYAQVIREKHDGRIVLVCQKALLPLLARTPGIDQIVGQKEPPSAFDVWLPLLTAPGLLETRLETIPAPIPYIHPNPELVERWRTRLAEYTSFKVGIAWQGSKDHQADRQRSVRLEQFAPLAEVPGVELFSLQKGYGSEQIGQLGGKFPVTEFSPPLDEEAGAFMDTAAVMQHLDLVVCSDTSVAHLAGAMGVPVWVALNLSPDWRWLLDRDDSPWYPSMRLFRQSKLGDWTKVFADIAEALQAEVRERPPNVAEKPTEDNASKPQQETGSSATSKLKSEEADGSPGVMVEVSPGELLDKITILRIKLERIADAEKLHNVRVQLETLEASRGAALPDGQDLDRLTAELKAVNESLWEIEDDIRECEREGDFGTRFIELARSVYRCNDQRAAVKRRIDQLLGSRLVEEKSYEEY